MPETPNEMLTRKDWTLLALGAAGQSGLSPAQLQKSLFLLGRAFSPVLGSDFYQFNPYNYGPFCVDIYSDADALAERGLVAVANADHTWSRRYALTADGAAKAEALKDGAPQDAARYLEKVVKWARGLTFQALVRAIYDRFPEQRAQSVFRD